MRRQKELKAFHERTLPSESEIRKNWNNDVEPLLSIVCIIYNHFNFINDCVRGFLLQETNFPFNIIFYDDASDDSTVDVIGEYLKAYPGLMSLVSQEENQKSKGKKIFADVVDLSVLGKYITRCEGDDYWTDVEKLQKQVSFLENDPSYVLATHDVQTIDEDGNVVDEDHLPSFYKRDFSARDLMIGWAGPVTQSMVFRNVITDFPPEFRKAYLGDVFLASLLGQHGKSGYLKNIKPSMYRIHTGGVFSPLSESDKHDVQSLTFFWIYRYFKRIGCHREARALKLRFLEKQLRDLSLHEWWGLSRVRFFKKNIRKWISGLLLSEKI